LCRASTTYSCRQIAVDKDMAGRIKAGHDE
jgi:hypothetical protein